jgi:hydroxymethylbilane synthase
VYPVALSLRGRRVIVVGGGAAAERNVRTLLDADAAVIIISPELSPQLAAWAAAGRIAWHARAYRSADLAGAALAFASSDDAAVDGQVVADARAAEILVNDASDAARSDFVTPATHRSGPLTVTVDGGDLAPSFTTRIRDELALQFDARYARAAQTLGALHERAQAVVPPGAQAAVMGHFAARDVDELAAMRPGAIEHEVERAVDTLAGVVPADTRPLTCATRASLLAITQTRTVMAKLAAAGMPSVVMEITTRGDSIVDRPLAAIGSDNVFVTELEHALRDGRADYAVHSCKDLPSSLPDDMALTAIGVREDARDVFCSERFATFADLPAGARVGTSSPRRRAQLRALRPDLAYDDIRGNVDTRLRKLRDGEYDAIVLAAAGMHRLGVRATHTVPFEPELVTPAVAQGALGIETRAGHAAAARIAAVLDHPPTAIAVRAERAFLRTVHGGCAAPVGAYAVWDDGQLRISAAIAAEDGSRVVRGSRDVALRVDETAAAEALGAALADALLAEGGAELLGPRAGPLAGNLLLLPSSNGDAGRIGPALRDAGADVVEARDSSSATATLAGRVPHVVLLPSPAAVDAIGDYLRALRTQGHRPRVAAMGPLSSAAAAAQGWTPDVVASSEEVGAFVQSVMLYLLENPT